MPVFMKLKGIQGAGANPDYRGWIVVDGVVSAVNRSAPTNVAWSANSRSATMSQESEILRPYDVSSSGIQAAHMRNTPFEKVEIHHTALVNGRLRPTMILEYYDAIVTSYTYNGRTGFGNSATESLTLNYRSVTFRSGAAEPASAPNRDSWDLRALRAG